jgi:LacI family transcriptional regulator
MLRSTSPNLRAIAAEAGVSVDTVSRVLNGRIKGMRRDAVERASRIQAIAQELNYLPNSTARAMQAKRTRQIGVLVRNNPKDRFTHPLSFETVLGINEGLESIGYILSVVRIDDVEEPNLPGSRVFRERMLDGMVVIHSLPGSVEQRIENLVPNCIWADAGVWRKERCIRRDEVLAGRLAAKALVDAGYRKIAWAGLVDRPVSEHYSRADRLMGVRQVCDEAGIELTLLNVHSGKANDAPRDLENWLRPDVGIVAYGVYQARSLASLSNTMRRTPGWDFGLVSCDGSRDIDRFWPGLSRVAFDRFEVGQVAAQMMVQILERPDEPCPSRLISNEWIAGDTAWGPSSRQA